MIDVTTITARDLAAKVRAGLAPEAVAEAFAAHIAAREPEVHAFTHWTATPACSGKGALAGVPFGVKDVFDTFDFPTEYGSAAHKGWQPSRDAAVVHQIRSAGAMLMGKTVSTEFATYAAGKTCNPHDLTRTPGGSSSGSAAALGAGMVLLAIGTQTAGSTVRPASFCGVVGMKPSRGLIPVTGMKPLAASLDVVGPMARDMRDLALLCSVVMRRPELTEGLEGALPRVGVFLPSAAGVDDSASRAMVMAAASRLGTAVDVEIPAWWQGLAHAHADVFAWEASVSLAPERELFADRLDPRTLNFLNGQLDRSFADWTAAIAARDAALAQIDTLFGDCDVLLTQAAAGEAPEGLAVTGNPAFNINWTLLSCPSLSLPAGKGPAGLPIGVQIVAKPGCDHLLLAMATRIEDFLKLS